MARKTGERLSGPSRKAYKGSWPRFAATVDENGVPNVVPLLSAVAADEETIIFSKLMVWKTARNYEANRRITINSLGYGFKSWTVKGEFIEYQTKGEYVDFFQGQPYNRYNAYMGVNKVGVIKIREVYEPWPLSLVTSLWKYANLKGMSSNSGPAGEQIIPDQVTDKFNRALALKYMAYIEDDGYPFLAPDFTIRLSKNGKLVFAPFPPGHPLGAMKEGMKAAAVVLAGGPVAYQVKGTYKGIQKEGESGAGVVAVEQVFTASPPVPGKRVVPREET